MRLLKPLSVLLMEAHDAQWAPKGLDLFGAVEIMADHALKFSPVLDSFSLGTNTTTVVYVTTFVGL